MTPRRVAVFTSGRADLGPLGPVIAALDADPRVDLVVIATGTHVIDRFGGRLSDLPISAKSSLEIVPTELRTTDPAALAEAHGQITVGVSCVLGHRRVELIVVLGDRWELLAVAAAAVLHGIPIAHLHGGETTEGAMDERIRHSITKLADLHLCATADSARRIRRLGEEPWRIAVTGAPGLDRVTRVQPMTDDRLAELVGDVPKPPIGMVVYHPPTVDRTAIADRTRSVLRAAASTLGSVLVLYPGADPGADLVIGEIEEAAKTWTGISTVRNLGHEFLPALARADVLIGNSSSGIIEAASLKKPVVNVGDRQRGRVRTRNVIDVGEDEQAIRLGIEAALAPEFRESLANLENPYGDGSAARRIVEALVAVPLDRLLQKPLLESVSDGPPLADMRISPAATLREAVEAIDAGRSQIALVTDDDGRLIGTISDGDVRRALLAGTMLDSGVMDHVTTVPVVASDVDDAERVLALMQTASVTQIPVVDAHGRLVGLHVMKALVGELVNSTLSSADPVGHS